MTRTLSTLQLPLNTNCLAFCPSPESSWLAAGCYQLSACRMARQGGLHILLIAGSSEDGLDVSQVCSENLPGRWSEDVRLQSRLCLDLFLTLLNCAGIFDMKWRHGSAGCAQLGLALSDGSVGIFTPSLEEKSLGPKHSLMIEAGSLATCVDFSARDESTLAVSLASGQLGVVQVCCCGCQNC